MKPGVLRLTSELPGVQLNDGDDHPVMMRLEAGTTVIVRETTQPSSDLVTIEVHGKVVTVFWADLQDRAEQVQAASKTAIEQNNHFCSDFRTPQQYETGAVTTIYPSAEVF